MGILSGMSKDEPLHYREVFTIGTALAASNGMIALYQTFYNHAGDADLRKMIEEFIQCAKDEVAPLEKLLKGNGVALPPAPPERADAKLEHIPPGARMNDPEISAALAADVAAGLAACAKAMGVCTREDVAMLFGQFLAAKTQLGAKMLRLSKQKGWLIVPPLHVPNPQT